MDGLLFRRVARLTLLAALTFLPAAEPAVAGGAAPVWVAPLEPVSVLRAFDPPVQRWEAGHRGVDLGGRVGAVVRAPASGTVTFAAVLAGRGVVVVTHAGGLRSTLEPVDPLLAVGDAVTAGEPVARLRAGHHPAGVDAPPTVRLHWGVLRGDVYLDPLARLDGSPPVLLPYWQPTSSGPALTPRAARTASPAPTDNALPAAAAPAALGLLAAAAAVWPAFLRKKRDR